MSSLVPVLRQNETPAYTYMDVLNWGENFRAEIIDGAVSVTASPAAIHQTILMELAGQLWDFLKGKSSKVFPAPFGVRLFPRTDSTDNTFVEPDIVVICDTSKLDKRGCKGAPDLIIEILSSSSIRQDRITKFRKYLLAGVREYWIVDPDRMEVQVQILRHGAYMIAMYDSNDAIPVSVLPGCIINLENIWNVRN